MQLVCVIFLKLDDVYILG